MGSTVAVRHLKPSLALKLAAGAWGFSLLGHSVWLTLSRGGFPPWGLPYLAPLALIGIALCGLLFLLAEALREAPASLRWTALGLAAFALSLGHAFVDPVIYRIVLPMFGAPTTPISLSVIALNFLVYVWLYGLYAAALELLSATALALENERRAAEARELAQEARLQALRFQLNPHFLFNTLNAISSLIVNGRNAEADAMLVKLAEFLRTTLTSDETALVPLAVELGAVEAYLEIEAARFGPALEVQIDCPEALLEALAPTFILQPLVENAVKYAVAPAGGHGRIAIQAVASQDRLTISVIDSAAREASPAEPGGGIGLSNTRQRLAVLYGDDARLEAGPNGGGFTARLDLPLRFAAASKAA